MASLALNPDASLLPQAPPGRGVGALLALLAHGLLIAALAFSVNWKTRSSDVVMSAELWAAVPQVAAPAEAAPPPAPQPRPAPAPRKVEDPVAPTPRPDPQIAIERAKRDQQRLAAEREAEQRKAEQLKAEKAREDKRQKELAAQREAKAEEERLAKLREANLARIRGLASAAGTSPGTAAVTVAPTAGYAGRIRARIKPNIVLTGDVPGNPVAVIEVRCAPDGSILSRRIITPSGNALWDETVLRAIDRTEILPRDVDGRVPSPMTLVFPRQES